MVRCHDCGTELGEAPLAYGADAPWQVAGAAPEEMSRRVRLTSDQCVVDGKDFFVRGRLEIPIRGRSEPFAWTVWTSLSPPNFKRMSDLWNTPGREREPAYFGWLSSELRQFYGASTLNLKTMVYTRPVGVRPFVEVEPTEHPLAKEQRDGIAWERVLEIAALAHHAEQPARRG